jgi:hypothetical protein
LKFCEIYLTECDMMLNGNNSLHLFELETN